MSRRRIIFYMHRERGHFTPTFKTARQLMRRGHQVAFLTTPQWAPMLVAHGFAVETFMETLYPADLDAALAGLSAEARAADLDARRTARMAYFLRGEMEARLRELGDVLVVADPIHYSAPMICAHLGLRCVQFSPFLYPGRWGAVPPLSSAVVPAAGKVAVDGAWARLHAERARQRAGADAYWRSYYDYVDALHRRYPRVALSWEAAIVPVFPGLTCLIAAPRALEHDGLLPTEVEMDVPSLVAPCAPPRGAVPARARVYVAFGSNTDTRPAYDEPLRALHAWAVSRPAHDFVFAIGARLAASLLANPPHVRVCASVDQPTQLAASDVMVGVGGLGSIKECLGARVPMVLVPVAAAEDVPGNTARAAARGAAEVLAPAQLNDPSRLDDALAAALGRHASPGWAQLCDDVARVEATERGADLLEAAAES